MRACSRSSKAVSALWKISERYLGGLRDGRCEGRPTTSADGWADPPGEGRTKRSENPMMMQQCMPCPTLAKPISVKVPLPPALVEVATPQSNDDWFSAKKRKRTVSHRAPACPRAPGAPPGKSRNLRRRLPRAHARSMDCKLAPQCLRMATLPCVGRWPVANVTRAAAMIAARA